jgi:hypothetical protein
VNNGTMRTQCAARATLVNAPCTAQRRDRGGSAEQMGATHPTSRHRQCRPAPVRAASCGRAVAVAVGTAADVPAQTAAIPPQRGSSAAARRTIATLRADAGGQRTGEGGRAAIIHSAEEGTRREAHRGAAWFPRVSLRPRVASRSHLRTHCVAQQGACAAVGGRAVPG